MGLSAESAKQIKTTFLKEFSNKLIFFQEFAKKV